MVFPKSLFRTDQRATGTSKVSDLQGPTHGGDYDPNDRTNIPSSQRNNTSFSDSWGTGPAHGGDYDPNQFDANHFPSQGPSQQYSLPPMASKSGYSGLDSSDNGKTSINSSKSAKSRLSVGASFHYVEASAAYAADRAQ